MKRFIIAALAAGMFLTGAPKGVGSITAIAAGKEAIVYGAKSIDTALQGKWILMQTNGFSFHDGTVDMIQDGTKVLTGTYAVNAEKQEIKVSFSASDGNISLSLPYTCDEEELRVFNDAGQELEKDGEKSVLTVMTEEEQETETPEEETEDIQEYRPIKNGDRGDAVVKLQNYLQAEGLLTGKADGIFGTDTETAIRRYQEKEGLEVVGYAGPMTQKTLFAKKILLFVYSPVICEHADELHAEDAKSIYQDDMIGAELLMAFLTAGNEDIASQEQGENAGQNETENEIVDHADIRLAISDINLGDVYIGKNETYGFVDILTGNDNGTVQSYRYWPSEHKILFGDRKEQDTAEAVSKQLAKQGVYEESRQIPSAALIEVVNSMEVE